MHFTFVDDSVTFDGYTPAAQPLGGPEKAFASLAVSLAIRGHEVAVFNRCAFPVTVEGSQWKSWDGERPARTDVLVAHRAPRLLEFVAEARHRLLWATGPAAALDDMASEALLLRHRPLVAFASEAQRTEWRNPHLLRTALFAPGVTPSHLEDEAMAPADPPRAICTTHPADGLGWLLDLWTARIRPEVPGAELHVYSTLLDKGQLGADVPDTLRTVLDRALAARAHGVSIKRPQGDPGMADAYRQARVHLYPRAAALGFPWTLAESQATGLPGVVRATSATAIAGVVDGQTGVVAATEDSFANAAINLLSDRFAFDRMSATARQLRRGRSWHVAAAELEGLFETVAA